MLNFVAILKGISTTPGTSEIALIEKKPLPVEVERHKFALNYWAELLPNLQKQNKLVFAVEDDEFVEVLARQLVELLVEGYPGPYAKILYQLKLTKIINKSCYFLRSRDLKISFSTKF